MKIVNDDKPSIEDVMAHHGVKGQKWGVRKAKATSAEIHAARQRQDARLRELGRHSDAVDTAPTAKARALATKKAQASARDFQTNEDRVTAARMTRGEKAAALILTGPLGAAIIINNSASRRRITREVDQLRTQVK
jgi:hypothetical protein